MAGLIPYGAMPMIMESTAPRTLLTPELLREAYKDLKWTGRQIGKAYKKRKRNPMRSRTRNVGWSRGNIESPASRVGSNVGVSNAKKVHTFSAGTTPFSNDTLLQHELALPQEGITPAQRQRNLINLRGFKICMEFDYDASLTSLASEFYLNVAVVADKRDPQTTTISGTRIFRDSNGTDRGIDFSAVPDSLGLNCLPLNSDKLLVFSRKKVKVLINPQNGTNSKTMEYYVPINRQIRFTETNTPDVTFHVIYWTARIGTSGNPPVSVGTVQYRHITYFRETCEC